MSSILKALKRAEQMRAEDKAAPLPEKHVYMASDNMPKTRPFIVVICLAAILLAGFYLLYIKKSIDRKPVAKADLQAPPLPVKSAASEDAGRPVITEAKAETAEMLNSAAIAFIKEKNYLKAEQLLRKAVKARQDNAELHNNLGMSLKLQQRYRDAAASYEKALILKPDYPEALNNLGVVAENTGDRKRALELYSRAAAIRPAYADAHLNLGLLLESMGRQAEAEEHFLLFINLTTDPVVRQQVKARLRSARN